MQKWTGFFFQFNRAFIVIREHPDPCFDVGGFGYLIHVMFSISLNLIFCELSKGIRSCNKDFPLIVFPSEKRTQVTQKMYMI